MATSVNTSLKTNGRWTKEEHENFILGLQMYGKNWKKIQDLIGTRNGSQIRSHAQKFFLKFKNEGALVNGADQSSLEEKDSQMVNSKIDSSTTENKYSDHSYFLSKIFEYSTNQQQFDLWSTMIDHRGFQKDEVRDNKAKRKGSFVDFESDESELQGLSSPVKKIKL